MFIPSRTEYLPYYAKHARIEDKATHKIVIELTNRCNLNCEHCFTGRHGGRDELPLAVLQQVLADAKQHGFTQLSFTGGEPLIYRQLDEALALTYAADYTFAFNTNGWNFAQVYPRLLPYRAKLRVFTFSLDGATEATHDRLRGQGSFRRVLQAMSICVVQDLPFTINMVVTAHNRHELTAAASLAQRLGSRGLRFGHLMHATLTSDLDFDLSPWERKIVEGELYQLQQQAPLPITFATGFYTTSLFPCTALHLQEINIDCHGNLTKCCHLSSHSLPSNPNRSNPVGTADIVGNLQTMRFADAYQRLVEENTQFHQVKRSHQMSGQWQDADFFPCWYCFNYYRKVDWLQRRPNHAWTPLTWSQATPGSAIPSRSTQPIELT